MKSCITFATNMNRLGRSVESPRVLNIEDLRRRAKRRLPRVVFDYIDGGAEDESTLRANCQAFEAVTFRPRCAVATPLWEVSSARARPGFRHWWSRSTRRPRASGNVTFAMVRKNSLPESSDQCCRL